MNYTIREADNAKPAHICKAPGKDANEDLQSMAHLFLLSFPAQSCTERTLETCIWTLQPMRKDPTWPLHRPGVYSTALQCPSLLALPLPHPGVQTR